MTKLEQEILAAIDAVPLIDNESAGLPHLSEDYEGYAKAAAEVARKYIGMAFHQNPALRVQEICGMTTENKLWEEFAKENGI